MSNIKSFRFTLAVLTAAVLTACGGGGGGGTTAPVAATPPPTVSTAASLITTVGPATYNGEQAVAFNLLNAERGRCGFGLLSQNAQLDKAAAAHANYSKVNQVFSHDETTGLPGFTGTTPTARGAAQGYAGQVGEVMASGDGNYATRSLLSGPYHMRALLDGYRDVGIGMLESNVPGFPYFVADLGTQTGFGVQQLGSSDVVTYPCDGTAGVNFQLRGEVPNPIPGRDLASNPIGTPVLIKVRDGNTLVITNAGMINVATGAPVALRAPVGAANDPNAGGGVAYFKPSEAYIAPDAPLTRGTAYQVTITGTNNGTAFSRTFSFTTGTGIN